MVLCDEGGNEIDEYVLPSTKYTLENMYGRTQTPEEGEGNDKIGKDWIDNVLMDCMLNRKFKTLNASAALPMYSRLLPYYSTDMIKPDVTVVTKDQAEDILVFTVEVYSENWPHTLKKALINVVNHLRILPAVDPSIEECVGYAFPGFASHQAAVVVRLSVKLKDLRSTYKLEDLERRDVKGNIKQHLNNLSGSWPSSTSRTSFTLHHQNATILRRALIK